MWYAFGRASDLGFVAKTNLTVSADGVVFVRLLRVKTAEEQGISIFPDQDSFITCPLHAIAVALVMQDFPSAHLLDHPGLATGGKETLTAATDIPLSEALTACDDIDFGIDFNLDSTREPPNKKHKKTDSSMTIYAYVNRIVKSASEVQARAKPTENLTSHSFRRGGAQHANSDPTLSSQWIFDRGSWNMTSTNKAFAYVFNTTSEDQKVARVLSGWDTNFKPPVPTLSWFDAATRHQARGLGRILFQTSTCAHDGTMRLNDRVIEVLAAVLIQHFSEVMDRYSMCPYATRMRTCMMELGIEKAQVLAWSAELQRKATQKGSDTAEDSSDKFTREETLINHQNCVTGELIAMNQALAERVGGLEKKLAQRGGEVVTTTGIADGGSAPLKTTHPNTSALSNIPSKQKTCGSKAHPKSPATIWFEWYAKTPRLWDASGDRQKKSSYKQIVNYMKLFLRNGFHLAHRNRATVIRFFASAKSQKPTCLSFLRSTKPSARTDRQF